MKILIKSLKILGYAIAGIIILLTTLFVTVSLLTEASNDRDWNIDQAVLPYAEIEGDIVSVHNIRNFSYTSTKEYTPNYYDNTFDLSKLKKVWYVVEPFSGIPGSAHTFLSFEFDGDDFVSISVEIRKEKGESYHPVKGLFNNYELMYVIADERDVIKLRTNFRNDSVYLYPIKVSKEKSRELFLDMIMRTNELKDNPEFYNTITNTCTTNIVSHVNKISSNKIPMMNMSILFPENSDKLAYELGLIDTELPFSEVRDKYYINDKALRYADDKDFSVKIRE